MAQPHAGADAPIRRRKPRAVRRRPDVDSSPLIRGGRVYVGSKDKTLYVLDLKRGELRWKFKASRAIVASPAIADGVLVIGDDAGNVYCLEAAKE